MADRPAPPPAKDNRLLLKRFGILLAAGIAIGGAGAAIGSLLGSENVALLAIRGATLFVFIGGIFIVRKHAVPTNAHKKKSAAR